MNSGIYTITHTKSKKVYVGSSANIKKRWRSHKLDLKLNRHHCLHLQRAYNKHGEIEFTFQLVEYIEPNRAMLLAAEQQWMDKTSKLYNTCKVAGSPLGTKQSKAHSAAISKALRGKPKSAAHNEANRLGQLARVRTQEEINRWAHNRVGSTQTPEHIAKRAASQKATKALKTLEEKRLTREKAAITRGSVVTIDGVQYLSLKDAEDHLGISQYMLKKRLS